MNDPIAAISTALGVGAISIIRVSGEDSIKIVNSITKNKKILEASTHTINYDYIVEENKIIDEVLISVMKAPKTFTCENIVEINAHGGISTTNEILRLLLKNGCRLAEPGEFTKRAFLNGRIDLTQAEAVSDLINSKTEKNREIAINQLSGKISTMIKNLRNEILEILANIEVNIDYPEYEDIEIVTNEKVKIEIKKMIEKIKKIIESSENMILIKEGIKTSIIGRPNVGKSSILNRLLDEEKAIVTEIAGTTRDIVEGKISLDGTMLHIFDTAGIRKTNDKIEKIGVQKSIELIDKSDLVLFVVSNNERISKEEKQIIESLENKKFIIVINKNDLKKEIEIPEEYKKNVIEINTIDEKSIEILKQKIKEMFSSEKIELEDMSYITNARSLSLLEKAYNILIEIDTSLETSLPIDILEIDIKEVWSILGEIIGETYDEELIDQLFSQFCLGK